jgi:hypothetical protein
MNPGERQVADTIEGIRRDHVARYEFVRDREPGLFIADYGCGVGYGSWVMGQSAGHVDAFDIDAEAIDYARKHWATDGVCYHQFDILVPDGRHDVAVAFECIEHLEDPRPFLQGIQADRLYASVPNESVFPHRGRIAYHYRHYTAQAFEELLNECGWQVDEWHGQAGKESEIEPGIQGRTQIAVCSRESDVAKMNRETWKDLPPVQSPPKRVAIVAMGRSSATFLSIASNLGGVRRAADEVWAINAMGGCISHNLLFAMDDLKLQEKRAEANPEGNVAGLMGWLPKHPNFFTSTVYDGYPGAREYPLEDVLNSVGNAYFNSTVAYAVAYAIHIGVEELGLYGIDYSYGNQHEAEKGRACVEFLLGQAAARGIRLKVAKESTLLDASEPDAMAWYGYDAWSISVNPEDGRQKIIKTPKDLPTVEEIERRYDKTAINAKQ